MCLKDLPALEVDTFDGLLVDYVERRQADAIVRGLRAVSDFDYEYQMAQMNRRLNGRIETVFLLPARTVRLHQLAPREGSVHARRVGAGARATSGRSTAARKAPLGDSRMERILADRMGRVSSSPTMRVLVEAEKLRQRGIDVVEFGAGEPDFDTPAHIKAAGHAAMDQGFTKYTPAAGTLEVRQAIAAHYASLYGVEYGASEVIVTAGGKQALYNAAMALFAEGDEVITHAPGWPTIPGADQAR